MEKAAASRGARTALIRDCTVTSRQAGKQALYYFKGRARLMGPKTRREAEALFVCTCCVLYGRAEKVDDRRDNALKVVTRRCDGRHGFGRVGLGLLLI